MNPIIASTSHTLLKSKSLLNELSDQQLSDTTVSPYYSCVGSHIRHILDFFDCILDGMTSGTIDLTARNRDELIASNCNYAVENVDRILNRLYSLNTDFDTPFDVVDDLGQGSITVRHTLGGVLAQANSHTIHHYAIISYILDRLQIEVRDATFGYNPTTPITVKN